MLKLAWRNLLRQKSRTLVTLVSIAFGVAGLILAGGFVDDILTQLRDATIKSRLGYVQIYKEGYSRFGRRDPYAYLIEEPEALEARLQGAEGVERVLKRVNFTGLLNNGRTDRSVIVEGIEPDAESGVNNFMAVIEGRQLTDADDYGLLLGEGVSASLDLGPGDYVTLITNTTSGAMNSLEFEVVGVFRTFSREFDARAVRIPLATAQELIETPGVHSLVLYLDDVARVDPLVAKLAPELAAGGQELRTWLQLDDFYPKTRELYRSQFGFLQVIVLGIVLLSVANSITMTANERVGEFGTLRALGHTSGQLYRMLIVENALLGLLGAALGVALGVALALGISQVGIPMPPPPNANSGYTAYISVVPGICAAAFAIGVLAAVISALLTCRTPTRVDISEALRRNI